MTAFKCIVNSCGAVASFSWEFSKLASILHGMMEKSGLCTPYSKTKTESNPLLKQ